MKQQIGTTISLTIAALLFLAAPFSALAQDDPRPMDARANPEPGISTTAARPVVTNTEKSGQTGVGLQTGSFTGVTAQHWIADDRTLNAAVAYARGNTAVSASHVWMFPRLASGGSSLRDFTPYVGAGAIASFGTQNDYFSRTSANENMVIAAQIPIGIEYLPRLERFDIFAELAPALEITPLQAGVFTANLGARYFF